MSEKVPFTVILKIHFCWVQKSRLINFVLSVLKATAQLSSLLVFSYKKHVFILIFVLLYIKYLFSLSTFKAFFLIIGFKPFDYHVYNVVSSCLLKNFQSLVLKIVFFCFSSSPFIQGLTTHILGCLKLSHISLILFSFKKNYLLSFSLDSFHCYVFKFTNLLFCKV